MYLINQRIILLVKMTVLLGVPLLCSFLFSWLSFWKLPSVLLLLAGYYLNNCYPDRILIESDKIEIKIFLYPEWIVYQPQQLQYQQGKHCIYLYVDGKRRYRISMERLSLRLYRQLTESLQPYAGE